MPLTPDDIAAAVRLETYGRVLAIREDLVAVLSDYHPTLAGADIDAALERLEKIDAAAKGSPQVPAGGVAVIPVKGMITPRPSLISLLFGGGDGSLSSLISRAKAAAASPDVNSIVLDVDSPGGMADGVPEAAAVLRKIAGEKPVIAVANTTMGSGAYWLASQAHEIVASPSSSVGSIGAYTIHKDMTAALDQMGVKPTIIRAGKYKIENNPYEPLSAEGLDHAQQQVQDTYDLFTADVAKGRGAESPQAVQDGYGEGRMLTAKRAVSAGLADRVATLDQTVSRLASGRARVRRTDDRLALEWIEADDNAPEALEPPVGEPEGEEPPAANAGEDYSPEDRDRLLATLAGLGLN